MGVNKTSFHILRVGVAITFLWIGVLIFKSPETWEGYMQPWAVNLLPIPIREALLSTAVLDIAVGVFLLIDSFTWIAATIGALHIVSVIVVSGITDITVRDLGLLAAAIALAIDALPVNIYDKIKSWKKVGQ